MAWKFTSTGETDDVGIALAKGERGTLMVRPEFVRFMAPTDTKRLHRPRPAARRVRAGLADPVRGRGVRRLAPDRREAARGPFAGELGDGVILGWDRDHTHLIRGRRWNASTADWARDRAADGDPAGDRLHRPLLVVAAFSIMPERVFTLTATPDFSAYGELVAQGYWKSLAWSLGMAATATAILFVLCWPLASPWPRSGAASRSS